MNISPALALSKVFLVDAPHVVSSEEPLRLFPLRQHHNLVEAVIAGIVVIDNAVEDKGSSVLRCRCDIHNFAANDLHLIHLWEERLGNMGHIAGNHILALCSLDLNGHTA